MYAKKQMTPEEVAEYLAENLAKSSLSLKEIVENMIGVEIVEPQLKRPLWIGLDATDLFEWINDNPLTDDQMDSTVMGRIIDLADAIADAKMYAKR